MKVGQDLTVKQEEDKGQVFCDTREETPFLEKVWEQTSSRSQSSKHEGPQMAKFIQ